MRYENIISSGIDRWNQKLLPSQLQVWNDLDSPNILFSGAYRAGKSEVCCRLAIRHALIHKSARVGVFRNYLKSIKQSTLITLLSLLDKSWVLDWSNSELIATLVNGSRISFFGCDDSDRIGSVELSFAFIDEAHEISEESLTMIRGRLSQDPLVWKPYESSKYVSRCRQLVLACNPKSKAHHLYDRFWGDRDGHKVYYGNTLENTYLPSDYIRNMVYSYLRPGYTVDQVNKIMNEPDRDVRLMQLSECFNSQGRRNLLGLWGSSDQQFYPDLDRCLVELPNKFELVIAGIDWGYNHPRLVKVGLSDDIWYTFGYYAPSKVTPDAFIDNLVDRLSDVDWVYVPTDQPGLIKLLKRRFSRVRRAKMNVLSGISAIASDLGKSLRVGKESSRDFQVFLDEMSGYERKIDSKTGEPLDVPVKVNDHFPDALRYAYHSHRLRNRDQESDWEDS